LSRDCGSARLSLLHPGAAGARAPNWPICPRPRGTGNRDTVSVVAEARTVVLLAGC
jgi:hypothetical protein